MQFSPPDVYIRDTGTDKGKGVYAARAFAEGETIEVCPLLILNSPYDALPRELQTVVFDWRVEGDPNEVYAVALGYGSFYNHDNPANLRFVIARPQSALRFVAAQPIVEGEELTINYDSPDGGPESQEADWFARLNIRPILTRQRP